jgi:type IV pilus assembly protein PilF
MPNADRSRTRRSHRVVALLACLVLAACTSTDLPPRPVTDGSDRGGGRSGGAVTGGNEANTAEDDQRRRAGIRLELAAAFYQQGNYAQALEELRQATTIDPRSAQAHGLLGLVHMDLGERDRAEASFRRALQLAPAESDILNNYGWFLCQTDRPREAIEQFVLALQNPLYPTPARPLHNAGICSLRAGDERTAEAYFQRSFQVDPKNPVAMYNLAELYLKRGDAERARFYAQRLLSSHQPSAETLWLAIRVDRRAGDRDSVASLSSQLRRLFPASREANLLQLGAFGD